MRPSVAGAASVALAAALLLVSRAEAQDSRGQQVYDRWCAGCHGDEGRGDGVAAGYMLPRPRDFTGAIYQIRTTQSGALPTDADILRVIDEGMPGTAMPGWREALSAQDREALVAHLKTFSRFFEREEAPPPLEIGSPPAVSEEGLAGGREFYDRIECWKCHGQQGRGDGTSAPTQEDDNGYPIRPADLSENWYFNGGGSVEQIYTRLRTGLDGTPMPSFSDLLEAEFMTDEQLWRVAQYVRSLAPEEAPRVREVVRAFRSEEGVPATVDDERWEEIERFYIPLVGQIVVRPRWFAPTVDGVWVQAVHDGSELALRLVWHDPSRSPDPAWEAWQQRVLETMEPREGGGGAGPLPDAIAVQFPRVIPTDMQRPYFLMGTAREPVYLWHWRSDREGAQEATASGLGRIEPLSGELQSLGAEAVFDAGEWRVLLRRSLAPQDSASELGLVEGEPIPLALFAWDGSNAEEGARGAVSSWYFIHLDGPGSSRVFVLPLVATVLTAGLGVVLVARAQRRERRVNGRQE
jgi:mono/diheme cytochrome c family protein